MNSPLVSAGYELNKRTGVWQRPQYDGIAYSDGDDIEARIAQVISEARDVSVLSTELVVHCTDWASRYHLSPERSNILRPIESLLSGDVLEVGAGCGAISRYLGECGGNIISLEGSPRRAAIARDRTRDLENVSVVSDNFDAFQCDRLFDVVVLIGVFEYASMFMSGERPAVRMLDRLRSFLKPSGKLIIAIENQLGLKYFAGAPEDHLSVPMYGIEGRYRHGQPETYGRKTISDMLGTSGFESVEFLAPFPDYKFPSSVISERGFADPDFDASALAWQSVWQDEQLPDTLAFNPTLVWSTVARNGLGIDLANSFLLVASNDSSAPIHSSHLAWHFATSRRANFCKITQFVRDASGIEVRYFPLSKVQGVVHPQALLRHSLPSRADYVKGECLSLRLIRILSQEHWRIEDLVEFVKFYFECLARIASRDGVQFDSQDPQSQLPGSLFDCIPQNVMVTESGELVFIDQEWAFDGPLELGYLLHRALFPAFHGAEKCAPGCDDSIQSRLGLFLAVVKKLGWSLTPEAVSQYAQLESRIIEEVIPKSVSCEGLVAWMNSPLKTRSNFSRVLSDRNALIADLAASNAELAASNTELAASNTELAASNTELAASNAELAASNADLKQELIDRDRCIADLTAIAEERSARITWQSNEFSQKLTECHLEISQLSSQVATHKSHIQQIMASRSWKLTQPMRSLFGSMRLAHGGVRLAQRKIGRDGLTKTVVQVLHEARQDGVGTVCRMIATKGAQTPRFNDKEALGVHEKKSPNVSVVPYYIDPNLESPGPESIGTFSLAVHLHVFYVDMLQDLCERLANIRRPFDLYVSVCHGASRSDVKRQLRAQLPHARKVSVKRVPNRGRDIAPLIVTFGKALSRYDIIGHFHTKKSVHNHDLQTWCRDILDLLLGQPGSNGAHVGHIFKQLMTSAKVVFPEGRREIIQDRERWGGNREIAQTILQRHTQWSVEDFPVIEFPEGSMFWARSATVRNMLSLPLTFEDFPPEPIEADGTLAHAIERLILAFAASHEGRNLRLHKGDSIPDYRFYEPQEDFSRSIIHSDIKVLSFYLPQFHPIPENDEWHGQGFTEWVKVRSALPLFRGHYQQHIPHNDIGYYLLESPDTLRKQAELMKKAGVYGQVFYHYWFNGRLILEQPAQKLLANPDIQMPFCFCWANENWTRRWDGNESEILLAQDYSEKDAEEFIRYLIPFFQDKRYIRIDERPVLFVYRPSSIPDVQMYLKVWAKECHAHGIKDPYVVAVLTRGAKTPLEFGMDAGVERVLHDWTAGSVPDIRDSLQQYTAMNGSALSYPAVADFYSSQTEAKDFTYFRSIIPMWDNTARYGAEAFVVHGSTPEYFQKWLEKLVGYSKKTLPEDRRFLLVNAWNEWAEGAHLEPDSRFGYSYLNSVGRALSDIEYSDQFTTPGSAGTSLIVHLDLPPCFKSHLERDPDFARRFSLLLSNSSIMAAYDVTIDEDSAELVPGVQRSTRANADFIVEFRQPAFFSTKCIEELIQFARCKSESVTVPNFYGSEALVKVSSNNSVESFDAYFSPIVVYPGRMPDGGFKNFRMCSHAPCFLTGTNTMPDFELPVVTTVIRFHTSADLNLLAHALGCLVAMRNCICVPLVATQDLTPSQVEELSALLASFPWHANHPPIVRHYQSPQGNTDIRSRMLNESLRQVRSQYAAFLDYDDLLMPHAYEWLIDRLKHTGKAVAFGRVYSTTYSVSRSLFIERTKGYEYGYSYADFLRQNHAPLHSFLLDLSKLDVSALLYHEEQRYMEDYFLTLQLFTEQNCDWESLRFNCYIGDYIHSVDRPHTLAFTDDAERQKILKDSAYVSCENHITNLRLALLEASGSSICQTEEIRVSNNG
jgi:lipopolysaccharide biosynthesis protein/protein-L-isoaspartate O-methyltransferase